MNKFAFSAVAVAVALSGCSLIPGYHPPAAPVTMQYPQGPAYAAAADTVSENVARQGWRTLFHDPALRQLVQSALTENRDLRVAALNVQAYRAQYQIQRADLFPEVSATAGGSRQRVPFLDAQRSLFSSQQGLITDRSAQLIVYTALGGAWAQPTPLAAAETRP